MKKIEEVNETIKQRFSGHAGGATSMTHACIPRDIRMKTGITDGLVRISVGIENAKDIIADLEMALRKV